MNAKHLKHLFSMSLNFTSTWRLPHQFLELYHPFQMEIDFLGINSRHSSCNLVEQKNFKNGDFMDSSSGEDDVSLSLCTSSYMDYETELLLFHEKKPSTFSREKINSTLCIFGIPNGGNAPFRKPPLRPSSTAISLYNLNDKQTNLRIKSELPAKPASLPAFYSWVSHSFHDTSIQKPDQAIYVTRSASSRIPNDDLTWTSGCTPVAMARKATLTRFLEKRSHRLKQTRTSHLMRKSFNVFEDSK